LTLTCAETLESSNPIDSNAAAKRIVFLIIVVNFLLNLIKELRRIELCDRILQ